MASFFESLVVKVAGTFTEYEFDSGSPEMSGLSDVNFFIGPNNSGKSRFLRNLTALRNFDYKPGSFSLDELAKLVFELKNRLETCISRIDPSAISLGVIEPQVLNNFDHPQYLATEKDDELKGLIRTVENFSKNTRMHLRNRMGGGSESNGYKPLNDQLVSICNEYLEVFEKFQRLRPPRFKATYIPIMRGLRPLVEDESKRDSDLFHARTRKDYPILDKGLEVNIFTGQQLYKTLKDHLLGRKEERDKIQKYQEFLSKEFFNGKIVELVPLRSADTVSVLVEGEAERLIYDLGDGIQSIIILTFMPFLETEDTCFMVEEPENYLHPGLQRRLIELYLSHPTLSKHQYFLTTHSNHLIDISSEMNRSSVFLFRPGSTVGTTKVLRVKGQDRNVLGDLGARSSSVFLTNSTIWVEGVTDRRYLRSFLSALMRERDPLSKEIIWKEDTHFSIAELGGSNLVHYSFSNVTEEISEKIKVAKICATSFVIVDGDNKKHAERMTSLRSELGQRLAVLNSKEIENLLPENVVKAVVEVMLKNSREHKGLVSQIGEIVEKDYRVLNVGLGEYLDKVLGIEYFSSTSGTLREKMKFCDVATDWMNTHADQWKLEGEAREICVRVEKFIGESNK